MNKKVVFVRALAVELGTIIGAGVLGLPYVTAKVGWIIGMVYLIVLSILITGLHLMIAEIALRTREPFQLVGLAGKYLGKWGKMVMGISQFLNSFGSLLAYLIGEGIALSALIGGSSFWWTFVFWIIGSIVLLWGLKIVSRLDIFISLGTLIVIAVIALVSAPSLQSIHLLEFHPANLFLPYGVFLFALMGASAIPQVEEIVASRQIAFKRVLIIAGIVVACSYALFITAVVGVTGSGTTEVATVGLGKVIGSFVLVLGNLFAIFAMAGGFLNVGIATKRTCTRDYKISHVTAWLITSCVPFILFLIGIRNFVETIGIVGAFFGTINTVLFILMYWRARVKGDAQAVRFRLHHAVLLSAFILVAFLIGALYTFLK